jgi:hypothetical protein
LGLHIQWLNPPLEFLNGLTAQLEQIRQKNAGLILIAVDTAQRLSTACQQAVLDGRVTIDELFDANYEPVEGSDPPQFKTSALKVLEEIFPAIQEPLLEQTLPPSSDLRSIEMAGCPFTIANAPYLNVRAIRLGIASIAGTCGFLMTAQASPLPAMSGRHLFRPIIAISDRAFSP